MRYPETAALILKARKRKGLSQEKAAQLVGCSRLQWINWEQGLHRPEKHKAGLVEVLGIDVDELSAADAGGLDPDSLLAPLAEAIHALVEAQVDRRLKTLVRS